MTNKRVFGVYRGLVAENVDPELAGRVKVTLPADAGGQALRAPIAQLGGECRAGGAGRGNGGACRVRGGRSQPSLCDRSIVAGTADASPSRP